MSDDDLVRQVADRMRPEWRGGEDQLLRTAQRRVKTASNHADLAEHYTFTGWRYTRRDEEPRPNANLGLILEHRVREAACLYLISRDERDAALVLARSWQGTFDTLITAVRLVLAPAAAGPGAAVTRES